MGSARRSGVTRGVTIAVAAALVAAVGAAVGAAFALGGGDPVSPPPALGVAAAIPHFEQELSIDAFHRGNLHTHSAETDGDSLPEDVYRWYRSHGYQFVALTDHNRRIDPEVYRHLERPGFKILAGEEVTMLGGGRQVHVNGICTSSTIGGGTFASKGEALRYAIGKVHAQGGIALVNHPNFDRSLAVDDLWQGREAPLIEIMSGHPYVYSNGVDDRPGHEALWAELLTRGARLHGVAVDDAHHFLPEKSPEKTARPGRAWVATYAEPGTEVDRRSTCEAIRAGRFYASNGAGIRRLRVDDRTMTVWTETASSTVVFLGASDEVLATEHAGAEGAAYTLTGTERWVRARVENADGSKAWTQAMRVTR